jgi:acetyltransferase
VPPFTPTDATLRDGRGVHLRALTPADEEALVRAFDSLGSETRYMRFMASVKEANRARLRKALASFPQEGFSIAAVDGAGELVGSATYVIGNDPASCEFAITVREAWAGAGLGRVLMTALIEIARERGLREMVGYVLAQNRGMLALAQRLGFSVARDPDDPTVRTCRLALAPPEPTAA